MHAWDRSLSSRPREKLLRLGVKALSEEELWCCVLGSGTRKKPLPALARSLVGLLPNFDPKSLFGRLGEAQYCRVVAVAELLARLNERRQVQLQKPEDVWLLCQDLALASKEMIKALYCNSRAEVIHTEVLALGGLNIALLQPKEIFFPLRWQPIDSIVLCHNHPSGNLEPSGEDLVFTRRIQAACELMGLNLRDHLIVAREGYLSLREQGVLTLE